MLLNKKGQYKVIRNLLIALLSFLVVLLLARDISQDIIGGTADTKCKLSLEAAARSKSLPSVSGVGRPHVKENCPRGELLIKKKDIVEGSKVNQNKAHQIIADTMLNCWEYYSLQGRNDPFSNWDNEKTSYCRLCKTIAFDDAYKDFINDAKTEKEMYDRTIHGFLPFLLTKAPPKSDKSYYELLYNLPKNHPDYPKSDDLTKAEEAAAKSIVLPGSAILIKMHKLDSKSGVWTTVGYTLAGIGVGVAAIAAVVLTGGLAAPFIAGAGLQATLITVGISAAAVGLFGGLGAYALYTTTGYAFSSCKDCNAVGGIDFVASEASFRDKIKISPPGKDKYTANLCDVLVN